MSFIRKLSISLASILLPLVSFAQSGPNPSGELGPIGDLISAIGNVIQAAIPVVTALALIGFFWGMAQYVFQSGDEEAQEKGKNKMIAGVVALFMIAAIGGIVELLLRAFGVEGGTINPTRPVDL